MIEVVRVVVIEFVMEMVMELSRAASPASFKARLQHCLNSRHARALTTIGTNSVQYDTKLQLHKSGCHKAAKRDLTHNFSSFFNYFMFKESPMSSTTSFLRTGN